MSRTSKDKVRRRVRRRDDRCGKEEDIISNLSRCVGWGDELRSDMSWAAARLADGGESNPAKLGWRIDLCWERSQI